MWASESIVLRDLSDIVSDVQEAEDKVDIEFILMTFWLNRGQETSVPIKNFFRIFSGIGLKR